jgi:hypothetical protein
LAATKVEASLVELDHTLNEIIASSDNALNDPANLVFALSLIGALTTEFLSLNVGEDFAETLKRIESLIAEGIRQQRDE